MKKLMLIAAAFATLVSCTKTQVIPTETAQQEISMKAYNQAAVKATGPIDAGILPHDEHMSVSAFYANNNTDYVEYFGNKEFKYSGEKNWHGTTQYYWPSTGRMKFIAVYPYNYPKDTDGTIECTYEDKTVTPTKPTTTTISKIDLSGWNSDNTNTQKDIMYSNNLYSGSNTNNYVLCPSAISNNLEFQHLLSQIYGITVTIGENSSISQINKVIIKDLSTKGDITITEETTTNITYTTTNYSEFTILENGTSNYADLEPKILVLPTINNNSTKKPSIVLEYTIGSNNISHEISLGDIAQGKKYIYNISMNMNEITFTASVSSWGDPVNSTL